MGSWAVVAPVPQAAAVDAGLLGVALVVLLVLEELGPLQGEGVPGGSEGLRVTVLAVAEAVRGGRGAAATPATLRLVSRRATCTMACLMRTMP